MVLVYLKKQEKIWQTEVLIDYLSLKILKQKFLKVSKIKLNKVIVEKIRAKKDDLDDVEQKRAGYFWPSVLSDSIPVNIAG